LTAIKAAGTTSASHGGDLVRIRRRPHFRPGGGYLDSRKAQTFENREEAPMAAYVVSFFNELCNDIGKVHKVCQSRVVIRRAHSEPRAVEAAKKRFARQQKVTRWDLRARQYEVEPVNEGERLG
jgi:hypothetical protein